MGHYGPACRSVFNEASFVLFSVEGGGSPKKEGACDFANSRQVATRGRPGFPPSPVAWLTDWLVLRINQNPTKVLKPCRILLSVTDTISRVLRAVF